MAVREEYRFKREHSIRRRVLRSLAIVLYRHPILAMAGLLFLTVAAGWRLDHLRLKINENLRPVAEPSAEVKRAWEAMKRVMPRHDPLTAAIRFPAGEPPPSDSVRAEAAQVFLDALKDLNYFDYAEERPFDASGAPEAAAPPARILPRLRPQDFERWREVSTPQGAEKVLSRFLDRVLDGKAPKPGEPVDKAVADWYSDPTGVFGDLERRRGSTPGPFPAALADTPHVEPDDRTVVLRFAPRRASSNLFYCVNLYGFLQETTAALRQMGSADLAGLEVEFYGRHVDTARRAMDFQEDMYRALVVMAACLFLLLILAFRKVESIFFVGLPPCVGLIWTYGLTSCFTSDINLLTAVFAVLLVALGLEFSVQIYHRFVEELYREARYYPALGTAYTEAGRGIVVSSGMTAAIFFSLYLSPFRDLRELAVVCGLGILCMALAALLLLPPMAALKSMFARGRVSPVTGYDFGLNQLSAAVLASPRTTLTLGLIVTAYLAFSTGNVKLNREIGLDLGVLVSEASRDENRAESPDSERGGEKPSGENIISILVEGETLQEALGWNDLVFTNLTFNLPPDSMHLARVSSLSPVFPSPSIQRRALVELGPGRLDVEAVAKSLKAACESLQMVPDSFTPFVRRLGDLQTYASTAHPLDLEGMRDPNMVSLLQKHISQSDGVYRILTTVVPSGDSLDVLTGRFDEFYKYVCQGGFVKPPLFDSEAIQNRRVSRIVTRTVALTVFFSFFWLVICVVPHFHGRLVDACLALLPLVCSMVWTFGLLFHLNFRIGLYALLIFPLIIGVAVDQSIILMQRIRDRRYASLRQVMRVGGRAGVVAGLIHILGLGCLVQVRFQALHEMATVALVAVVFSTVGTIVLVPAVLQVRRERRQGAAGKGG